MTARQQSDSLPQPDTAAAVACPREPAAHSATGIDPLGIAASAVARAPVSMPPRTPRSKSRQRAMFLSGPIPWAWLACAMALPGKALHVAIQIWHEVGFSKSSEVAISMTGMARMGVSRWAASRGLEALEKAGLVSVVRHPGRKPVVTILTASPAQGASPP